MRATPRWVTPTLVGERVMLRPIVAADAEAMWEEVRDPEGNDLTATTATFTFDEIARWCASREDQDQRLDLAIIDRESGEYAGEVVLNEYDAAADSANFRIALRGPAWVGRGLGTEATRLVVDHGLGAVGLSRITLCVLARNPRARRVYEKVGFEVTGTRVEDGEVWVDLAVRRPLLEVTEPIVTPRLVLRPIEADTDVEAMHAYRSMPEVCRYVPFVPGTLAELRERLTKPPFDRAVIDDQGQALGLAIARRDTGKLIGDVVLFWNSTRDREAEIGYVLHPDHTGSGYAAEAATALVDLAVDGLGAHRVTARMDARNTASAALVTRLGMRQEAAYVEGEWFKGEWTTLLVFAVLEREWRARDRPE